MSHNEKTDSFHKSSDLIDANHAGRDAEAMAIEGYRLLAEDTADFVKAAFPLALEVWPEWEQNKPPE